MKYFCENNQNEVTKTHNEFYFVLYHENCYKKSTRRWNESKIFHFARNEISCKHPLNWLSFKILIQLICCFDISETFSIVSIIKLGIKLVQIYEDFWTFCYKNIVNNHFWRLRHFQRCRDKTLKIFGPFTMISFNCLKAAVPLWGDSLHPTI